MSNWAILQSLSVGLAVFLVNSTLVFGQIVPVPTERPTASPAKDSPSKSLPAVNKAAQADRNSTSETDDFIVCQNKLRQLGVKFSVETSFKNDKGCGIADPVVLSTVKAGPGIVRLPGEPTLSCAFALRFSTWLGDVVAPIAAGNSTNPLTSVATGPGYVCRSRNNVAGAKISEHAFGNAIDISSFQFKSGERVAVSSVGDGPAEVKSMLSALRTTACGYFTTVLGPGSNAAHKAHFHLDYGKHGRTWNYRICE